MHISNIARISTFSAQLSRGFVVSGTYPQYCLVILQGTITVSTILQKKCAEKCPSPGLRRMYRGKGADKCAGDNLQINVRINVRIRARETIIQT